MEQWPFEDSLLERRNIWRSGPRRSGEGTCGWMDENGPEVFCITHSSPLESTPLENILNNQCDKTIQPGDIN